MKMSMEFQGLDNLIEIAEKLANEKEIIETNEKIFKECGALAKAGLRRNIPRSKDVSKSGKKGDRPSGHLADNVPSKVVRRKAGYYYLLVGWENISRKTEYFYVRFLEWGTSKMPPVAMFGTTQEELKGQFEAIGLQHYEELIKRLEG